MKIKPQGYTQRESKNRESFGSLSLSLSLFFGCPFFVAFFLSFTIECVYMTFLIRDLDTIMENFLEKKKSYGFHLLCVSVCVQQNKHAK